MTAVWRFERGSRAILRSKSTYAAGELDGPDESYDENGQLRSKSTHAAGELDGPDEDYYENGRLRSKVTIVAGERDGPDEFYYENGQLGERGVWSMGEKCGEWLETTGGDRTIKTVTYPPCPPGLEDGN